MNHELLQDSKIVSLADRQAQIIRRRQYAVGSTQDVDVEALAADLGVEIREVRPQDNETRGAIYRDQKTQQVILLVNPDLDPVIKRYTIAHELSHLLLHPDRLADGKLEYRTVGKLSSKVEREAEELAAEILLPAKKLRYHLAAGHREVWYLARLFGVSQQAMTIRLAVCQGRQKRLTA